MKDIINFIKTKRNDEIVKIQPYHNAFLVQFKYEEPESENVCYICGRKTNTKSKAGYICSFNRKSMCQIVFKCQVCGKIFRPQKPNLCIDKPNLTCSHKCAAQITMLKWHKENPELSHELAIKQGKMNGGKAFKKEWDTNHDKMIKICSKGGIIGGRITAEKGYWKQNDNLKIFQRYFDKNDVLYNTEKGKGIREKQALAARNGAYKLWNDPEYEESRKIIINSLINISAIGREKLWRSPECKESRKKIIDNLIRMNPIALDTLWNDPKYEESRIRIIKTLNTNRYKLWNDPKYAESRSKILQSLRANHPYIYTRDNSGLITHINDIPIIEWYSRIGQCSILFA